MTISEELEKAQEEFKTIVGACFVLLKEQDYDESRIVMGMMQTLLDTIEEIQDFQIPEQQEGNEE